MKLIKKVLIFILIIQSCFNKLILKNKGINEDLLQAAADGDDELLKELVKNKTDINVKNSEGETALHLALQNEHKELAELLINKGADIKLKNNEGETALHLAIEKGYEEIVELLINKGADMNAIEYGGYTALHRAAFLNEKEKMNKLVILIKNKKISDEIFEDEINKLNHLSIERIKIVKLLIDRGIDINIRNSYGETALHVAVECGYKRLAVLLINNDININAMDENGKTALHLATENNNSELIELLVNNGANV